MSEEKLPTTSEDAAGKKTLIEQIEVASDELVDRVKGWIEDASVSKIVIRKEDGEKMLEIPVATGGAIAGALTLFAPVLAAVAGIASLLAKVKVDIVREPSEPES